MKKFKDYKILEGYTQLTKDISLVNLECRDGTPVPPEYQNNALWVAKNVQAIKDYTEKREGRKLRLSITSGYRTPSYNSKGSVRGAQNSQHLTASAIDFKLLGLSISKLLNYIHEMMNDGLIEFGGVARYDNFVHYDVRGDYVTWNVKKYPENITSMSSKPKNSNNLTQLKNKKEEKYKNDVINTPSSKTKPIVTNINIDYLSNIHIGSFS